MRPESLEAKMKQLAAILTLKLAVSLAGSYTAMRGSSNWINSVLQYVDKYCMHSLESLVHCPGGAIQLPFSAYCV